MATRKRSSRQSERLFLDPMTIIGLASVYAWIWLLFWCGPFSLLGFTIDFSDKRWGVDIVVRAITIVIIAALSFRGTRRVEARLAGSMRAIGLVCGLLGTALGLILLLYSITDPGALMAIAIFSGALGGIYNGVFLCLWCVITASLGVRAAIANNMAAMMTAAVLYLLCNILPVPISYILGLLCPVASYICSIRRSRSWADASAPSSIDSDKKNPPRSAASSSLERDYSPFFERPFMVLMGIALIFGISYGFMCVSYEIMPDNNWIHIASWMTIVAMVATAVLAFCTTFLLKLDAWQLVFRTAIPLMALGYLIMPYRLFWYIGPAIHDLGVYFFFVTFWTLLGSRELRHGAPTVCTVSLGLAVLEVGVAIGLGIWRALYAFDIIQDNTFLVSGIAMFAIFLCALLLERPRSGWSDVKPGDAVLSEASHGVNEAQIVARLASKYDLTSREIDVCMLLGRGRSRQFIANELDISIETAKTHVARIYRKLEVHSQQGLLDIMDIAREELEKQH